MHSNHELEFVCFFFFFNFFFFFLIYIYCVKFLDDNTGIFHVFEMRIGMNEFDHCILAVPKQQRQRPENLKRKNEQVMYLFPTGIKLVARRTRIAIFSWAQLFKARLS